MKTSFLSKAKWGYLFFPVALLFMVWLSVQVLLYKGYRINWTRSMPVGIYKLEPPTERLKRGDVVEFCPPYWVSPAIFPFYPRGRCNGGGEPMLKEVVAVGGDVVDVTNSGVLINSVHLRDSAPLDKPELPRLRGRFELKDMEIWVFGSGAAPDLARYSFDSRYFGPVAVQNVMGMVLPKVK